MNREELNRILEDHKKWLNELDRVDDEGRANFHDANLREIDLHEVNLRYANLLAANLWHANMNGASLQGADLQYANLIGANLQFADLQDADMKDTNLKGANLQGAILCGANLRGANLLRANLLCADLQGADLRGADLRGAELQAADLRGANLQGADLRSADLRGTDLRGADLRDSDFRVANISYAFTDGIKTDKGTKIDCPTACPETGSFIAWKKAGKYIVKLEIPEDAERSSATTNKCRASKVMVLEIQNMDGTKADVTEIMTERCWIYKIGEMVYPDEWDDNRWNECSNGIHFFMTREEAVEW